MNNILTTGQVAKICQVAPRTVSKWFDSGLLHGFRIPGNDRRIPLDQLLIFLRAHNMTSAYMTALGISQYQVLIIDSEQALWEQLQQIVLTSELVAITRADDVFHAGMLYNDLHPLAVVIDDRIGQDLVQITISNIRKSFPEPTIIGLISEDRAASASCYDKSLTKPVNASALIDMMMQLAQSYISSVSMRKRCRHSA